MTYQVFRSLGAAVKQIQSDTKAREKRLRASVIVAARKTRRYVGATTIPIAHRELIDSLHIEQGPPGEASVVADAPHAAAVERGSRPHMPPLEPLIEWVILRGSEGLTATGIVRSEVAGWRRAAAHGATRVEAFRTARVIAKQLKGRLGRAGAAQWRANMTSGSLARSEFGVDPAVVAIARSIQMSIAKHGTKPSRYMARAVPQALAYLEAAAREALPDR